MGEDISKTQAQLDTARKLTEMELENMRRQMEQTDLRTTKRLEDLEESVKDVSKELRASSQQIDKVLHICIGVDGSNGLRGNVGSLNAKVDAICRDFEYVKQTAKNYNDMKSWLVKFCISSSLAFLVQFGGGVWFFATMHSHQEATRSDVNKTMTLTETLKEQVERLKPVTKPTSQNN